MPSLLINAQVLLAGGILAILAFAGWGRAIRRQECRNLASVFAGEIVAVLQAVDAENADQTITPDSSVAMPPHLVLPRFTVYEANAGKLDHFAAPLPRKITYFFDRMSALERECSEPEAVRFIDDSEHGRHLGVLHHDLKE